MKLPIYLDNHATTPLDPRALDAMLPYLRERFGNAASLTHSFGRAAADAVGLARGQVASLIGASPEEIVFTSGATESDNLAIKGAAEALEARGNHVITVKTEHKAVLDSCKQIQKRGFEVTYLSVDRDGLVDPADLRRAITDRTILISIMFANNESGVIQPLAELAGIARERGVLFHTDAVQAVGKIPLDVREIPVDLISITAHKLYGPKGTGALYVRSQRAAPGVAAQMHGGGHEREMRSGTLNVPGIVGLGAACAICEDEGPEESVRAAGLRDRLIMRLQEALPQISINGHPSQRLPGSLNMSFHAADAEAMLAGLQEIALSSGAACTTGSRTPSYVLTAMGLSKLEANSSLRFGIGRFNSEEEIDYTAGRVIETVERLRTLSPLWEG